MRKWISASFLSGDVSVRDDADDVGAGKCYVVFGNERPNLYIFGEEAGDQAGFSMAKGSDINGNGYDDIIIGCSNSGDGIKKKAAKFAINQKSGYISKK